MARKIFILTSLLLLLTLIKKPWPAKPQLITINLQPLKKTQLDNLEKQNPLSQLITAEKPLWKHRPNGDTVSNGYLYYYHSHRKSEHGHFHIFVANEKTFSHLIAISISEQGKPLALFTTNKWVTGETSITKKELLTALENFHLEESTPLNTYLNALIHSYSPHIAHLIGLKKPKSRRYEILPFKAC